MMLFPVCFFYSPGGFVCLVSDHPSVTKHCLQPVLPCKLHDVHSKNSNKPVRRDTTDDRVGELGACN